MYPATSAWTLYAATFAILNYSAITPAWGYFKALGSRFQMQDKLRKFSWSYIASSLVSQSNMQSIIDHVMRVTVNVLKLGLKPLEVIIVVINKALFAVLRVRPISSSRITEFSQHEANGCEAQEDLAAEVEIFPVLGKPAATIEPRNGALDDPSARQNDEAFGPIGTLDDFGFELRSDLGQRRMEDRPRIGAVGKEPFQKRKQAEKRGQQQDAAVAILNIGRMNNRVQQQTLCIYQDVPLLALDELARVESGRIDARSAFFSAFHTLAVDDGGGGT